MRDVQRVGMLNLKKIICTSNTFQWSCNVFCGPRDEFSYTFNKKSPTTPLYYSLIALWMSLLVEKIFFHPYITSERWKDENLKMPDQGCEWMVDDEPKSGFKALTVWVNAFSCHKHTPLINISLLLLCI